MLFLKPSFPLLRFYLKRCSRWQQDGRRRQNTLRVYLRLRHLWNEATTEVAEREVVFRWLSGQRLTDGETQMLGHYSTVPVERQRQAANLISAVIQKRLEVTPSNVVEIRRASV